MILHNSDGRKIKKVRIAEEAGSITAHQVKPFLLFFIIADDNTTPAANRKIAELPAESMQFFIYLAVFM